MSDLITIDHITAAAERIAGHVLRTPTVASPGLTAHLGVPVTLKLELLQRSGSFKPRGAFNKLLGLTPAELAAGAVAVSGGNHGIALADVAGSLDVAATVVMPESRAAAVDRGLPGCGRHGAPHAGHGERLRPARRARGGRARRSCTPSTTRS